MSTLNQIRADLKKRRASRSSADRALLSASACLRALEHWKVMARPGDLVLAYRAQARWGELAIDALLKSWVVAYPRMNGETLEFAVGHEWLKNEFGFEEPAPSCPTLSAEEISRRTQAILVPGLGFGSQGQRLGMGKGHYDRFLPRVASQVPRISLSFDDQVLDEFSNEWEKPWDQRVDWIVTPTRVLRGQRTS